MQGLQFRSKGGMAWLSFGFCFTFWPIRSEPTSSQIMSLMFWPCAFFLNFIYGNKTERRSKSCIWMSEPRHLHFWKATFYPLFNQETSHTRGALWLLRLLTVTSVILPYHICWLVNQTIEILHAEVGKIHIWMCCKCNQKWWAKKKCQKHIIQFTWSIHSWVHVAKLSCNCVCRNSSKDCKSRTRLRSTSSFAWGFVFCWYLHKVKEFKRFITTS